MLLFLGYKMSRNIFPKEVCSNHFSHPEMEQAVSPSANGPAVWVLEGGVQILEG